MTRTHKIVGGVAFGYLNAFLVAVVGLWLTPFLLGRLGAHDLGLWFVGLQIMGYVALLDVGVVALVPREAAYATGRAGGIEAASELPQIIGQAIRVVLLQLPVAAAVAFGVWYATPADWEKLHYPLGLMLLGFLLLFPCRIFQAVLQGLQDLVFLGGLQAASWALGTGLMVVLVLGGGGLVSLVWGGLATQALMALGSWVRIRRRFPEVWPRRLPEWSWLEARKWLRRGLWISVSQVAQPLLNGSDLILIAKVLGPSAVVPFACTQKLIAVLANQPQVITQAAAPALSELRAGSPKTRVLAASSALTQALMITSGLVFCIIVSVNAGFVGWWVGGQYYGGGALTVMFLVAMLLRHWNATAVYGLFCFGYERRTALTTLADGVLTVAAALVGIWLIGPIGAPLGAILGVTLTSLPMNLTALADAIGVRVTEVLAPLKGWLWRFLLLASLAALFVEPWTATGVIGLVAISLVVVVVYGLVMFPLAFRSPLGDYVRPTVASIRERVGGAVVRAPTPIDS